MEYVTSPALAVSVDAFKASVNILPEDSASDTIFEHLLGEAQDTIAQATGHQLAPCRVAFTVELGTWRRWWLPVLPVTTLVAVEIAPTLDSDLAAVDFTDLRVQRGADQPQLILPEDWAALEDDPALMRVTLDVGHVTAPLRLQRAVKLLAKEWYEAQIAVDDMPELRVPMGVTRLIRQSRYKRPCQFGSL